MRYGICLWIFLLCLASVGGEPSAGLCGAKGIT